MNASLRRWAAAFAAAVMALPVLSSPVYASQETGTLITDQGQLEVLSGDSPGGGSGNPNGWYRPGGWDVDAEDKRGSWFNYRVGRDFAVSAEDIENELFYPGQWIDSSGNFQDNVGGPPCRYGSCNVLSRFFYNEDLVSQNRGPVEPGRSQDERFAMSAAGLCPRAWVAAVKVRDSSNPLERYEIIKADRLEKSEQCTGRPYELRIESLPCRRDGRPYEASLGFIFNREIWTTAPDDQNWIYWRTKIKGYTDANSPFTFEFQEVTVSGGSCTPITVEDNVVDVQVGRTSTVDVSEGLDCPQAVGACTLVTEDFRAAFQQVSNGAAQPVRVGADGRVSVRGLEPGQFRVPFTFSTEQGVEDQATLTVNVMSVDPDATDRIIILPKGQTGTVDLWVSEECPDTYTCSLDTTSFLSAFNAARSAAGGQRPVAELPCVSDVGGRCSAPRVNADGRVTITADRWEGEFDVPFTIEATSGRSAVASLTVRVVPVPPTVSDQVLTLQVGDSRIVDLLGERDCPTGYECSLLVEQFRSDFEAAAEAAAEEVACIDGFGGVPCGGEASYADGRTVIRANTIGSISVPFEVVTNFGDAAQATLTINVVADTPGEMPVVTGDLLVTRPPVGYVAGSYDEAALLAEIVDVRFRSCPSGYQCTPAAPEALGSGSQGFSLYQPEQASGTATVTLSGPYKFCLSPNRCDAAEQSVTSTVGVRRTSTQTSSNGGILSSTSFAAPGVLPFSFYRATSPDVPYTITADGQGEFSLVRWRFVDVCEADGVCTSTRFDQILGRQPPSALDVLPIEPSNELTVVGPRLK